MSDALRLLLPCVPPESVGALLERVELQLRAELSEGTDSDRNLVEAALRHGTVATLAVLAGEARLTPLPARRLLALATERAERADAERADAAGEFGTVAAVATALYSNPRATPALRHLLLAGPHRAALLGAYRHTTDHALLCPLLATGDPDVALGVLRIPQREVGLSEQFRAAAVLLRAGRHHRLAEEAEGHRMRHGLYRRLRPLPRLLAELPDGATESETATHLAPLLDALELVADQQLSTGGVLGAIRRAPHRTAQLLAVPHRWDPAAVAAAHRERPLSPGVCAALLELADCPPELARAFLRIGPPADIAEPAVGRGPARGRGRGNRERAAKEFVEAMRAITRRTLGQGLVSPEELVRDLAPAAVLPYTVSGQGDLRDEEQRVRRAVRATVRDSGCPRTLLPLVASAVGRFPGTLPELLRVTISHARHSEVAVPEAEQLPPGNKRFLELISDPGPEQDGDRPGALRSRYLTDMQEILRAPAERALLLQPTRRRPDDPGIRPEDRKQIMDACREAIGPGSEAVEGWVIALTLLPGFTGTLPQLLRTARAMAAPPPDPGGG